MKLYLSIEELDAVHISRIHQLLGGDTVALRTDYSENAITEPDFLNSEIVFGNVPALWFEQDHIVRWAQLDSVGFGEYRAVGWESLRLPITLTNLAGFFADPVAQTALAGILALYRGMDKLSLLRSQTIWQGDPLRAELQSLSQSNVALIGYGSINRRLEELLNPFHCAISSFRRSDSLAKLDTVLPEADIIVCTLPETDDTVNLFDARRLSLLKASALFVNCGRGSVVDELALADALNNQALAGAVIDVTVDEPLSAEHPFWTTPNTVLSQHSGGGSKDELDRKIGVFADNLTRYRQGQQLLNTVDFERGY